MSPEVSKNDIEDRKISEKPDAIKKEEDITKKYPDLDAKEKGILSGLDINGTNPEDINKGMDDRFDKEIQKAGLSGQTSEITEGRKQLSEQIAKTTDMKEKIALYQEFLDGLKSEVGALVAEQKQNGDSYGKALEKTTRKMEQQKAYDLGLKIKEAQNAELNRKNAEKLARIQSENAEKLVINNNMDGTITNPSLLGWPPEKEKSAQA